MFLSATLEQIHEAEEDLHEALAPALKDLLADTGVSVAGAVGHARRCGGLCAAAPMAA